MIFNLIVPVDDALFGIKIMHGSKRFLGLTFNLIMFTNPDDVVFVNPDSVTIVIRDIYFLSNF